MTNPREPMTPLAEAAANVHEMYLGILKAGFTPQQALYLVGQMIIGSQKDQEGTS